MDAQISLGGDSFSGFGHNCHPAFLPATRFYVLATKSKPSVNLFHYQTSW